MSRHIIEGNLNGEIYRNILENELPTLLENLSLQVRQNMWFQHNPVVQNTIRWYHGKSLIKISMVSGSVELDR